MGFIECIKNNDSNIYERYIKYHYTIRNFKMYAKSRVKHKNG